jgi:hypothetical protein
MCIKEKRKEALRRDPLRDATLITEFSATVAIFACTKSVSFFFLT